MSIRHVSACRCCGGANLIRVLDLDEQPLANDYFAQPRDLPTYPLELCVCADCFHNQLSLVVPPELMFRHYLYVSGTSRTLREHFDELADEAIQWLGRSPHRVLDLACNDGTLLEAFRRKGGLVAGVDPALNLVEQCRGRGLDVIAGFWPEVTAQVDGAFDLITACNVLAHVHDPAAFLAAALQRLNDDGLLILEFPYCREMILRCEWDTIYHEHLSYFLAAPFMRLIDCLKASIVKCRIVPIHGGSLRIAIRRGAGDHCSALLDLAKQEQSNGLHDLLTYVRFAEQVEQTCRELQGLAHSIALTDRKFIGYGASAKGNTLLNRCPLPLSYIVDDNPLKHGLFTPGSNIPIRPTASLADDPDDLCILLLAWNFADEVLANVRQLRPDRDDLAALYVPKVSTFPIAGRKP